MSSRLPIALSSFLAMALALAAGPASALGLGQIQVKSRPGQPLLAEIPIISSDPAELQGLKVQLASPETFARVGLDPPQGLVSSLHFEPALDAGGRPVIRVTSLSPVQQPLLTFLLEVDWGQGRLVREYSALLDAPRTVSAPVQPLIQAPTAAPSNTIARPSAAPVAAAPVPNAMPAPVTAKSNPAAAGASPSAAPKPSVAAEPLRVVASPAPGSALAPVHAGQTLSQITADLDGVSRYTAAQTMLALLRANPDAFIGGNINRLKRGAVLRVPQSDELSRLSQRQAAALVHEQIAQWREASAPAPQPAAVASGVGARAVNRDVASTKRSADARLEIMPTSTASDRKAASRQAMQSGIQAGGEGEMLRQQLQEIKETLAARDAEVNELKTRVAELENLQQQQRQLLTLKDSALAAAQQNLAVSNRQQDAPAVAAAATTQIQPPAAVVQPSQGGPIAPWLWGGLALVLAAMVAWWFSRQRRKDVITTRRTFDTQALAASIPVAAQGRDPDHEATVSEDAGVEEAALEPADAFDPMLSVSSQPTARDGSTVPTWHGATPVVEATTQAPPASAGQQLELAQAYLDLGDDDAARALLRDVLDGRDPAARDVAARLLRDL